MEWISVDERLPEDDIPVIAAVEYGNKLESCPAMRRVGGWADLTDETWVVNRVLFWMPLPESPKVSTYEYETELGKFSKTTFTGGGKTWAKTTFITPYLRAT